MAATVPVRRAARGEAMKGLARWGLAARATVYLLVGVLALAIAFGKPGREADQRGALQELVRHPGGSVLVWVLAIGLAGYALWRLSEAAFGVAGEGNKAGPRVKSLVRGLIYAFLALSAFKIVTGGSSGSQSGQQELWTAKAMQHSGGRIAVGLVGAIIVICGLLLVWEGLQRKFEKHLRMGEMSPSTRKVVEFLGVVGTTARGVVFAVAGVLVIVAAVDHNPKKAGGLDRALRELASTSAGPLLLVLIAVGLVMFGLYGYAEAKWRRV